MTRTVRCALVLLTVAVPAGTAFAQQERAPALSPIVATFERPVTTYTIEARDADGDVLTYTWALAPATCGTFTQDGPRADWSHPDHADCSVSPHPGVIEVVVSDGAFRCTARYTAGSAPGRGTVPEPCGPASRPSPSPGNEPQAFPPPPPGAHARSAFPASLRTADDVSTDVGDLVRSLLIVLALILLIVFPSQLFNATVEEHRDEIRGWFGLRPHDPVAVPRARRATTFVLFAAAAALLGSFLDPSFGADRASLALFLGLLVSGLFVTFVFGLPSISFARTAGTRAVVRAMPGALAFAVVCVVISRLAGFRPGYFYGVIAGFVLARALSRAEAGRSTAYSAISLLVFGIAAYTLWSRLQTSAAEPDAGLAVLIADAVLAALFVGAIEGLVFGLVPLRFLPGEKLFAWSKAMWVALFGVGAFLFVHVLLDPSSEYVANPDAVPLATTVGLFVAFGIFSVAFWGFFRLRARPEA